MTSGTRARGSPPAAGGPLPLGPPDPPHLRRRVQGRKLLRIFSVPGCLVPGKGWTDTLTCRNCAAPRRHPSAQITPWLVRETKRALALSCGFTGWQVLGSNQRRLSRRFYRPASFTAVQATDLGVYGFGTLVPQRRSVQVPCVCRFRLRTRSGTVWGTQQGHVPADSLAPPPNQGLAWLGDPGRPHRARFTFPDGQPNCQALTHRHRFPATVIGPAGAFLRRAGSPQGVGREHVVYQPSDFGCACPGRGTHAPDQRRRPARRAPCPLGLPGHRRHLQDRARLVADDSVHAPTQRRDYVRAPCVLRRGLRRPDILVCHG